VSAQLWNNSPPFNRPRVRSGARRTMTVPGGPVRLLTFRALPRGFDETISNPLGYAQSGLFGSLVIRLALCGCKPQFKTLTKHALGGHFRSAFWIGHTVKYTDKKYLCNPIGVRIIIRTLRAVKNELPSMGMQTMDARQQRGLEIAAVFKITQKGKVWICPSQTGKGKYTVCTDKENPHCSCPDHEAGYKCKHIFAVEYVIQREFAFNDLGEQVAETTTVTQSVKRTT